MTMVGKQLRGAVHRVAGRVARSTDVQEKSTRPAPTSIERYLAGDRAPWSDGYGEYRWHVTEQTLADADLMRRFKEDEALPAGYGVRLDERVIEYPWVLSRLSDGPGRLLDAGSTFNYPSILERPVLAGRQIVIVTLAPGTFMERKPNVSYLFNDLRDLILRDSVFDTVVCISTLEHIGLDNTQLYSTDHQYAEHDLQGYQPALSELRRVLKPGGRLLLTVPFGAAEDHGWLQQFDQAGIQQIIAWFGGGVAAEVYYGYSAAGWQISTADACAGVNYFNVHASQDAPADGAAAARAVCCLELIRA